MHDTRRGPVVFARVYSGTLQARSVLLSASTRLEAFGEAKAKAQAKGEADKATATCSSEGTATSMPELRLTKERAMHVFQIHGGDMHEACRRPTPSHRTAPEPPKNSYTASIHGGSTEPGRDIKGMACALIGHEARALALALALAPRRCSTWRRGTSVPSWG